STPPGTVDLYELAFAVDEALPKDRVYVSDSGRFMFAFWEVLSVPNPRSYVDCNGFSSIGLGAATAMGAAVAAAGRPTVFVTGDGGFMLGGLSELATAVAEQLDLVIVVANDSSYGAEHIALTMHNMDPDISLLPSRDFARIAEAFGCQGMTVTSKEELQKAMAAVNDRDRKRPLVIDVKIYPASVYGRTAVARPSLPQLVNNVLTQFSLCIHRMHSAEAHAQAIPHIDCPDHHGDLGHFGIIKKFTQPLVIRIGRSGLRDVGQRFCPSQYRALAVVVDRRFLPNAHHVDPLLAKPVTT